MGTTLVTGVTGQIGYYVAELLRQRGETVWGLVRQSTLGREGGDREPPYRPITGDLLDEYSLMSIVEEVRPDRIFNFAAQSFVPASWAQPVLTAQYTGLGVVRLLEAVRRAAPGCRFLQAGSSELFAGAERSPQDETAAVRPMTPYGIAKAFAFHTVRAYRERYGLHATNAVFFTNESGRRSPEFVFRKVTRAVAEIVAGRREPLAIGNLETVRDWGYAPEYADLSIAILERGRPDEFVVATGQGHTVRELVTQAFALVGLDWQKHIRVDSALVRPSERVPLIGDSRKLQREIGRTPRIGFDELLKILLADDLRSLGCKVPFEAPAFRR